MEDIARVADRVLVMNESKVFLFDETAKVFSHAKELEQIGLRVPQVTKIMMKLHENGYPCGPCCVYTGAGSKRNFATCAERSRQ